MYGMCVELVLLFNIIYNVHTCVHYTYTIIVKSLMSFDLYSCYIRSMNICAILLLSVVYIFILYIYTNFTLNIVSIDICVV